MGRPEQVAAGPARSRELAAASGPARTHELAAAPSGPAQTHERAAAWDLEAGDLAGLSRWQAHVEQQNEESLAES